MHCFLKCFGAEAENYKSQETSVQWGDRNPQCANMYAFVLLPT